MADRITLPGLLSQTAPYVDYLVNNPLRQIYNVAGDASQFLTGVPSPNLKLARNPFVSGLVGGNVKLPDREVAQRPVPAMVQMNQPVQRPVQPQSPAEAGIQKGSMAGLLGGAIGRMMDRSLYSTPTFGGNFITEQASGEVALRGMESAAAQKQQEAALKAAEIQAELAKAGKVKPSAEVSKIYDSIFSAQRGLETINKIKGIMSSAITTGGAGAGLNAINNIAAAFNINLGKTGSQSLQNRVAELRKQLIASRAFGREANKDEQRIIRELIPDPGIFTNIDQLEKAYANVASELENKLKLESGKLSVYGLPRYSDVKRDVPLFTRN